MAGLLKHVPRDDNPSYGGLVNFASNINPNVSRNEQMIQAFNYGFRVGYQSHTEETLKSLRELKGK